jgi:prolyl-tRNA synthetase
VFRAEQASVEPLLREREFLWFEAHTAFASEDAAYKQIEIDSGIVQHLADHWGLPVTRVERGESDRCPGAVRTWGFDVPTADGRLNQVASTHLLGQRFAKVFNLRAREDYVHQTSFGIGLSRLVAAVLDHNPQFGGADDRITHGAGPGHTARPVLDEDAGAAPPA